MMTTDPRAASTRQKDKDEVRDRGRRHGRRRRESEGKRDDEKTSAAHLSPGKETNKSIRGEKTNGFSLLIFSSHELFSYVHHYGMPHKLVCIA
jgi:hypothetical protein